MLQICFTMSANNLEKVIVKESQMIRSRPISEHTIFAPRPNFPRVCFNPYFVPDKTAEDTFLGTGSCAAIFS